MNKLLIGILLVGTIIFPLISQAYQIRCTIVPEQVVLDFDTYDHQSIKSSKHENIISHQFDKHDPTMKFGFKSWCSEHNKNDFKVNCKIVKDNNNTLEKVDFNIHNFKSEGGTKISVTEHAVNNFTLTFTDPHGCTETDNVYFTIKPNGDVIEQQMITED